MAKEAENGSRRWWEVTVRRDVIQDDGTSKSQAEHFLVHSLCCTDAENRIMEGLAVESTGDIDVTDIKQKKYKEIFCSENPGEEKWYHVKANIITIDEKSGKEKKTGILYLVQASDLKNAVRNFESSIYDSVANMELDNVKASPIIDVFHVKD